MRYAKTHTLNINLRTVKGEEWVQNPNRYLLTVKNSATIASYTVILNRE